jgi:acyl dehydratase
MQAAAAAALAPITYEVIANNLSRASENRIHDDTVARRFGFTGALVPGVEVHAYACHPAVARWGRDWLARGTMESRFLKPVYDQARVLATAEPQADGASLAIRVESGGALSATATAALPERAEAAPAIGDFPWTAPPANDARPEASEERLAPGLWLWTASEPMTPQASAEYLEGIRETEPLYAREGLVHPGLVLRLCNRALTQNVRLGPWIHVGSAARALDLARVGEALTVRAKVLSNEDRKGHRIVELDALVVAEETRRAVARVRHTAIWRVRGG